MRDSWFESYRHASLLGCSACYTSSSWEDLLTKSNKIQFSVKERKLPRWQNSSVVWQSRESSFEDWFLKSQHQSVSAQNREDLKWRSWSWIIFQLSHCCSLSAPSSHQAAAEADTRSSIKSAHQFVLELELVSVAPPVFPPLIDHVKNSYFLFSFIVLRKNWRLCCDDVSLL